MIVKLLLLLFSVLILPNTARAEQDLRELILELTSQVKALKNQVTESNARIDQLEQALQQVSNNKAVAMVSESPAPSAPVAKVNPAPAPAIQDSAKDSKPVVTAGDIKGTIKIPGTDTSIGIGGFVKLDTLFSSVSMGKDKLGNQRLEAYEIPVGNIPSGDNDQITMHAKESRLWVKSFTPSRWGDINTLIEMDFYGDPGAYNYTPRLRHGYGTIGNFLAGQTWTTFLNSSALGDTLDNSNSVGALLTLRQPQIRWTQPFSLASNPMDWQIAMEAPRTRVWDASHNGMNTVSTSHYPDLVTRFNFHPTWGSFSLAGLGRHLQYTPQANNTEQSTWAGAVSLAGKVSTTGADNLRFMLNYGNALGRYAVNNFFADASINAQGEMQPITSYSGMLAYQHWWGSAWRSNLIYGIAQADQPSFASTANRSTQSVHANLLWSPITQTTIGLEYIYANREWLDSQNGELHRLHFSTRFNF